MKTLWKKLSAAAIMLIVLTALMTACGTDETAPCDSGNCGSHPTSGNCHCHGHCGNDGCECHGIH